MITVKLLNKSEIKVDEKAIRKLAQKTLKKLLKSPAKNIELSIVLVGDAEIKKLNKKYRKVDRVTDVLSFSAAKAFDSSKPLQNIGEVIICLPQARRQAKRLGHSLDREIEELTVHAIIHLMGYDHDKDKNKWNKVLAKAKGKI